MADRAANRGGVGTKVLLFVRAVVLFAALAVGVPWALLLAARERFGGASPFHGVPAPADWSATRIRTALTERLTEQTIADIVIRLALVVAWVGVAMIVVTVVFEVVHMLRHDGLAMPDIRGFGYSQRTARAIASGLLVVVPLLTSPATAIANDAPTGPPERGVAFALQLERSSTTPAPAPSPLSPAHASIPESGAFARPSAGTPPNGDAATAVSPDAAAPSGEYVVRAGDSIYGIAERRVGPDTSRVAAYAERLVDLNLGRRMPDGRQFTNAAFIDVGWVLQLPDGVGADPSSSATADPTGVHRVEAGESLWSIADEEVGDPSRWPEVYEANEGRTFADGRRLDDPDLIQPGWDLQLPAESSDEVGVGPTDAPTGSESPASDDVESLADVEPDDLDTDVPERLAESIDPGAAPNADVPTGVAEHRPSDAAPATERRVNVWDEVGAHATGPDGDVAEDHADDDEGGDSESSAPAPLVPLGSAAMLSAGVLTLLAVRRRAQLRSARPRARLPEPSPGPAATERALRTIDVGERFVRVETAVRAAAAPLVGRGERVLAVFVGPDGGLELHATGPVDLAGPWEGHEAVWHLAASTPLELLTDAARAVSPPCPALVQLGTDRVGRDVYVDLEALEAIEVGGPGDQADAIVAAITATLSGSVLAEVTTLVGVGVPDEAFLGHRRYVPATDSPRALDAATAAIGSTGSAGSSTFELRSTGTATETWEPAVVLVGASAGTVTVPAERTGLAVVSAAPIHGPSSRLAPDGDDWVLQPAGIRLTPVGLTPDDVAAISDLVTVIEPEPDPAPRPDPTMSLDPDGLSDHTIIADREPEPGEGAVESAPAAEVAHDTPSDSEPSVVPPPAHELLVRMIGRVGVVDRAGNEVSFERSKTRELVAWLATHRERSTRSAARTALWELDVRDATFANVVSEARRSLARLVEPPEGDEWVGRTMTDDLPLHDLVLADVDLLRHALDAARVQPPAQAIATLEPAVELIAGMPFEGTSYLWPDSEGITSDLVLLATTATTELAAHCLSIGDIEGVFRATSRGLQVLPAHEELIGLRMEAHARAGDHAGVRQEWESYERVINGDPWSDGEPAPKLVELRQRLLNPSR